MEESSLSPNNTTYIVQTIPDLYYSQLKFECNYVKRAFYEMPCSSLYQYFKKTKQVSKLLDGRQEKSVPIDFGILFLLYLQHEKSRDRVMAKV